MKFVFSGGSNSRRFARPLAVVAVSASLLAAGTLTLGLSAGAATKAKALTNVTIGMNNGNIVDWEEYAAYTQGFFKQQGIAVTFVNSVSSVTQLAAVSSGGLEVLTGTPEGTLQTIQDGLPLQAFDSSTYNFWTLTATNKVPTPTAAFPASLAELKGDTIGVNAVGSGGQFVLEDLMSTQNLSYPADYTIAGIGGTPTSIAAVSAGEVQADFGAQPILEGVEAANAGYQFASTAQIAKAGPTDLATGVGYADYWAKPSWIKAHPALVLDMQKALAEAYVWSHKKANFSQAEGISASYYGATVTNAQLAQVTTASIADSTAWLTKADIQKDINFDVTNAFIKAGLSASTLYYAKTPTTLAAATKLLAPAPVKKKKA